MKQTIKAVFFDAGGVLILNNNGEAMINQDVLDFIDTHKSQCIFGVLSSTNLPLVDILKSYGIDSLFTIVQTSRDSKEDKDSKGFFLSAVEKVGIKPSEAVMVDNDTDFIAAAKDAGLKTILYTIGLDLDEVVGQL